MSDFLWGAATSSHQIEGGNFYNDWWAWESQGAVEGGVRSGAATDHLKYFREDLQRAKDLGLNSYRFSLEWSRFEPEEGAWSREAVEFYSAILDECDRLGLCPMVTLQHFTIPQWLAKQGGLAHELSVKKFLSFVEKVAKLFASRVPLWCTVNEPIVLAVGSYLGGFMPPAKWAPKQAGLAIFNLLRFHVGAYDILKGYQENRTGVWRDRPLEVGFAHNMLHFRPDRRHHIIEIILAKLVHRFYNIAWLDAVTGKRPNFYVPGLVPRVPELPQAKGRVTTDFIGINYYTKALVQWRPRQKSFSGGFDLPVGVRFARKRDLKSDLGWALHPAGLGAMISETARYGLPIYITENGCADKNDSLRTRYLLEHLHEIAKAQRAGCDIRGYFHWSLLDNFEWIKGYWPRFGLYNVDYETQARSPRGSALVYRDLIAVNPKGATIDPALVSRFLTEI